MYRFVVFTALLFFSQILPAKCDEITVLAGSAGKPVLEEAVLIFERDHGASVTLILGSSGEVLTKVRLTGQGDVYLPGSHDFMMKAKALDLIATETERTLAYLVPAICVPINNPANIEKLEDLAKPGVKIAIGHPETVCVGLYAAEILEMSGLASQTKGNIIAYLESCAKVANSAALGSVDAVLGWREFAYWAPEKIHVILLPQNLIPRIATLPGAVLKTARNPVTARKFIEFLGSEEGKKIYRKWGYFVSEEAIRKLAPDAEIGGFYDLPDDWK